jgi:cyclophilin family peptidyl-prolyl cis-trans isomerase
MLVRALPLLCALACACGPARHAQGPRPGTLTDALAHISSEPHDVAVLDLGELGRIRIELLPELAPKSVAYFTSLADQGFYDGTTFHRVIPGFMIQGGDPLSKNRDPRDDGRGNSGERLPDEFSDYPQQRGTVSLANSGAPNSSVCQFFIVQQDARNLDGGFTVIGRVVDGMQTVDAVTHLPIDLYGRYGPPDRPYPESAVIRSVHIERARAEASAALAAAASPG